VTYATRENGCLKLVPGSHKNEEVLHCNGARPGIPGFIARNRAHPESELRDPAEWTRLWHEARTRLAAGAVDLNSGEPRFDPHHPWCA
jgi:ectoine hydroxylase-related dioxygenase (phytanoyl-CoA dioxygenase family)